ncbi:hypothetical protein SAMN04488066_105151 [Halorubrum aquaticum]|uniref:Tetrapyrrole biosynthesis glutamyl-tRNA reductase dimerisation domain-containing protein n=1 Tax=Halorubrum aquaticum TaxID=387340 RepID=A0A1I3AEX0_9EURY|nr:glutamyl-tRNA reductase [Halorubrum aquaticum]SFH48593.1 hypothetical protein SAMN04488066_105151 [Halorubrum aquaticum]
MPESRVDGIDPASDPERLRRRYRRRLRRRAARIERRELEEAVSALEARGTLADEQRETLRALASTLVGRLTVGLDPGPERTAQTDPDRVRALARLLGVDEERSPRDDA